MAESTDAGPVPPKLDLRKSVILRAVSAPVTPAAAAMPAAPVTPAASAVSVTPAAPAAGPKLFGAAPGSVRPAASGAAPAARAEVKPAAPGAGVPVSVPRVESAGAASAAASKKRETSRIPIETARLPVSGPLSVSNAGPKTIRIKPNVGADLKPMAGTQQFGVPKPVAPAPQPVSATVPQSSGGGQPESAKRATSRISLDAALGSESAASIPAGATTIKLKKPGEALAAGISGGAMTIKLKKPGGAGSAQDAATIVQAGDGASPTQKKTVRVKRSSEASELRGAAAPAQESTDDVAIEPKSDEPHFLFPVFALISALVAVVLVYVLLAQCIGPDVSLTQVSMGARDVDLPWPGKIAGR